MKEVKKYNNAISETRAKGVAKLVSADTKHTKATERMYYQTFAKEETRSRKDKRYHEVKLSIISEKHDMKSHRWDTRVSAMKKNFDE